MYLVLSLTILASLASASPFWKPLTPFSDMLDRVNQINKDRAKNPRDVSPTGFEVYLNHTTNLEARQIYIPPSRGCGTAISFLNVGETLIGDGECHYILSDIDRMHVGSGCDCVTFSSSACGASEPKYWTSWHRGPTTEGKLPKSGTHFYACSDEPAFGKKWGQRMIDNFPNDVPPGVIP